MNRSGCPQTAPEGSALCTELDCGYHAQTWEWRKRLEELKEASRLCVNEKILPLLQDSFSRSLARSTSWSIESDPNDPDKQTLLFAYPSAFSDKSSYLLQTVKIEMGARSDTEPKLDTGIRPYLADAFPDIFTESAFTVKAVSPVRTFWEKAMLLHEETFRPQEKKRKARMARHYYDLWCLINAGIGGKAVNDIELFNRIAAHRQVYFSYSWVDYDTLRPGSLKLVPTAEQLLEEKQIVKMFLQETQQHQNAWVRSTVLLLHSQLLLLKQAQQWQTQRLFHLLWVKQVTLVMGCKAPSND